jgi:purine-binding chemotaxis protein CheW
MLSVERPTGALCKVLRFAIADHHYVAAIDRIREIVLYRPSVPVPHAPAFLEGVIDLRGLVIPLIDLRERLGIPATTRARPTHILIVGLGESVAGLIVDQVRDVLELDSGRFQIPEATEASHRMCRGVCRVKDDLLVLVDLNAVLSADERAALSGIV